MPANNPKRELTIRDESGELEREATVAKMATVQIEGGREVTRPLEYYNLDAIISVGYRINSPPAPLFSLASFAYNGLSKCDKGGSPQ